MRCIRLIFSLALPLLACQPTQQEYAPEPGLDASPLPGAAEPPQGPLASAMRTLEAGDAKEVVKQLSAMQPVTPLERAWHRLLLGQAWFELGAAEKAVRLLQANYEELRDARPAPDPNRSRVLARSLKKLGAYYRDKQDYERACTLHQLQWLYMKKFGSLLERHEVLISLDVDAALLRDYFASEQWLRESLLVAQQMPQGLDRQRSLIISWNNLSATLMEVLRFPEAEGAARESRRLAQLYDGKTPRKEFREVRAIAQHADVLAAWAQHSETVNPKEARPLHERARGLAVEALALGEQQGLDGVDRVEIEQRMRKHCGQNCR